MWPAFSLVAEMLRGPCKMEDTGRTEDGAEAVSRARQVTGACHPRPSPPALGPLAGGDRSPPFRGSWDSDPDRIWSRAPVPG